MNWKWCLVGVMCLAAHAVAGAETLNETFDRPMATMTGWTFVGRCQIAPAEGLAVAKSSLSIDGCGYAESPKLAVIAGKAYQITGWGKTEGNIQNNSSLKVKWYDNEGNVVYWEFVRRNFFTNDWRKYEKLVIVPDGATSVAIVCHAQAMWGRKSTFAQVSIVPETPSPIRFDMHFDRIEDEWFNDRSPYGNDGEAFCLKNEDIIVSQTGGAANFQNRKAKVRLYHSQSLAVSCNQWVMVMQFFPEEPMYDAPETAHFTLIDTHDYYVQYHKEKDKAGKTVFNLVVLFRGVDKKGQSVPSHVAIPIELFRWYRLAIKVSRRAKRFEVELLVDGEEVVKKSAKLHAPIGTRCPIVFVGCKDYPRQSRRPWPWGLWGRMDYIKIYDSFAAYNQDRPNLRYGGFGK